MLKVILATGGYHKGKGYVFGNNNELPWPHIKEDMKRFSQYTKDSVVLMGANTWKSLPKSLPNRIAAVLSSSLVENKSNQKADVYYTSFEQAISDIKEKYPDKDVIVIGGARLIEDVIQNHNPDEVSWSLVKPKHNVVADVYVSDDVMKNLLSAKVVMENKYTPENDTIDWVHDIVFQPKK